MINPIYPVSTLSVPAICALLLLCLQTQTSCTRPASPLSGGPPVHAIPSGNLPFILPFDESEKVWDIHRIADREETRIEFPHLSRFGDYWYLSFREGDIHGNHLSGRARVIRSYDGIEWETAALFESAAGDVRDPRLSISPDGRLILNASIRYLEEAGPFRILDDQEVVRESVTWVSQDGVRWSGPHACPSGLNTWRWDVAWYEDAGYSISYGGKDPEGALYRTRDGKHWELVRDQLFPGGHGNEAALSFGPDGTLYVLLRGGLNARAALGISQAPDYQDWQWAGLEADWDGTGTFSPVSEIDGFERDLGGPILITLEDGRLLGAGRVRGQIRIALFFIDPAQGRLTRILGVDNGSSYPGIFESNGEVWLSYIGHVTGNGPIRITRIRLPE